ncbi:ring-cleaving dioxygenase [Dyadobacter sp. LHD-138]|uniref:ring-cleaving dioxygenase n=1 Tax=Dyadobacter sp. LHD-138 TaxID=3071413 RepID=UPI0027DEDEB7|nr:ring-cleaving dioxygenase [Dyadobacter sp. LHD-138]MDQ6478418.1 ring-cleaving dioxygenase [Dyadobacter sp. LHD-138]
MNNLINGLHHITALASDAQRNVDFYVGILGLRMVKKTVNFDAPDVYHLYYGDETGTPGSIVTFFPYAGLVRGRKGGGQLTFSAFSIPTSSLGYWMDRLVQFGIPYAGPYRRFNETYLRFEDFDGMGVELVANDTDKRPGWDNGKIPKEYAIRGAYTVSLNEFKIDRTVSLLTDVMGHRLVAEESGIYRFESGEGGPGSFVDVLESPKDVRALQGAGSVHHLAFATESDETQLEIREKLLSGSYHPTEVLDRNYFHSIYYREPGGILFEIATNPPGFFVDETVSELGSSLKLPEWFEARREKIEAALPVLSAESK